MVIGWLLFFGVASGTGSLPFAALASTLLEQAVVSENKMATIRMVFFITIDAFDSRAACFTRSNMFIANSTGFALLYL
jgi:hypothetical protein